MFEYVTTPEQLDLTAQILGGVQRLAGDTETYTHLG